MGCGIYKITNIVSKKVYIGSSVSIPNREYKHFWLLTKGAHDNQYLQKSFNKYGRENFVFEVLEYCDVDELVEKENDYILLYDSCNPNLGYNLATVNDFRRNTYNDVVKINLSRKNLLKNGNIKQFSLTNIKTGDERVFETLVDAATYLISNGFAKGNPRNVRMKLSQSLRGKIINNGFKGSIRKTCYKHNFKILN